jgi:hypothetical protein
MKVNVIVDEGVEGRNLSFKWISKLKFSNFVGAFVLRAPPPPPPSHRRFSHVA